MNPLPLNQENLAQIGERITVPGYDRKSLKTGIVHVGVGGFHRSHQANYIHQLLQSQSINDWGICGVGLREADRKVKDVLEKQDFLYTLVVQHPDGKLEGEVIGSLTSYLLAADGPMKIVDKMAAADTRIVSLTITEGGYNFNPQTEAFNFDNPDVQHELSHPDQPRTIFGYLAAALKKRRAANLPPFSILSCDNIQHNGNMARAMVLAFTRRQDPELAQWIEDNVSFPNTMVDRITPSTTPADVSMLEAAFGIADEWPVICEPFIQWVVEDDFSNGRPPLESVGVQFVEDVSPYEKMKIRLLNAGHSVLGIPGAVHGHPTIDACMDDAVFARFMRSFMDKEATPVLGEMPGTDLEAYKDTLEERFANPNLKDGVARICLESSSKLPKFLIPTIRENLAAGGSTKFGCLILATWCYYHDKETNEKGNPIDIIDTNSKELHLAAANPLTFLKLEDIFGDLANNPGFVKQYVDLVRKVYATKDVRKLMEEMI